MIRLVAVAAAAIAGLWIVVRVLEPRFAFFPSRGVTRTPADDGIPFDAATIETSDGERLHGWLLRQENSRAFVVYFHGNGGNLSVWLPVLAGVAAQGYAVAAADYGGYGASTGRPSERGLYRDVDAILAWAWQSAPRDVPVVYWGRSLGATMAAYAATRRSPDGVILEAGYPDARSLLRASPPLALLALFSSYRFPTADYMRQVRCPVLAIHGDADQVVPFSIGRALYDSIDGGKEFVTIHGGDHNDLVPREQRTYWTAVDRFVGKLRR